MRGVATETADPTDNAAGASKVRAREGNVSSLTDEPANDGYAGGVLNVDDKRATLFEHRGLCRHDRRREHYLLMFATAASSTEISDMPSSGGSTTPVVRMTSAMMRSREASAIALVAA